MEAASPSVTRPGRLARLAANFVLQLLGIGQQRLHLRKHALAHFGQLDAAAGAVEQPRTAFALQRVELPAQQRLVAVEEQRRARQAAELADREEGAPLLQVGGDVDVEVGGFGGLHGGDSLGFGLIIDVPTLAVRRACQVQSLVLESLSSVCRRKVPWHTKHDTSSGPIPAPISTRS